MKQKSFLNECVQLQLVLTFLNHATICAIVVQTDSGQFVLSFFLLNKQSTNTLYSLSTM